MLYMLYSHLIILGYFTQECFCHSCKLLQVSDRWQTIPSHTGHRMHIQPYMQFVRHKEATVGGIGLNIFL